MSSSNPPVFAAATPPVQATVIHTPDTGLVSGPVEIPVKGGTLPAWRSAPEGPGPFPIVLVVQEIFGVHEHIKDVTRRLARLGYLAIAPELYFRQGDASVIVDLNELREKIVSKVPDAQVLDDLDVTLAWAAGHGGDVSRAAITGFCWGGRITWLYAAHNPRLKAGIAWYGRLAGPATELQPTHPVDVAPRLRVPVLGLYGGQDTGIPLADVDRLREALRAADVRDSSIHVYDDAPHAFHADYRPSYRETAARDGWERLRAWLKRHGL